MDLEVPWFCTWKSPFTDQKVPFCGPGSPLYCEMCTYRLVDFNLKLKTHQKPRPGPGSPPLTSKIYKPLPGVDPEVPFCFFEPLPRFVKSAERTRKSPCLGAKLSALPKEIKIFQVADNFRILSVVAKRKIHEWEGLPIPKRTYKSPFIFWELSMAARLPQFAYAQTQH